MKSAIVFALVFPLLSFGMTTNYIESKIKIISIQKTIEQKWIDSTPIITNGKEPLLIIGDSWSRRLAFGLNEYQTTNKKSNYKLLLYGVGNESIMDPDYFIQNGQHVFPFKTLDNYFQYWESVIKKYHPKKVLIITGLADQAQMVINGRKTRVGISYFNQIYQINFSHIVNFFHSQGIDIYLTNMPNNARNYSSSSLELNKISDAMNNSFNEAVSKKKIFIYLI